jgi:2-keto-4-pentenoate hydratase/2-oxohepta-3-ene-1,7-dioic acid hydratase in catechol pathway
MLLFRTGPEGFYAAEDEEGVLRILYSDPFETLPGAWELGRPLERERLSLLPPVLPGKVIGVGRNYRDHAAELGNAMPKEPLLFLKAPSAIVGPRCPIVLPPESERVEFEGEIALVLRRSLRRATREQASAAVLGVTAACDVTARDLQKKDATFARAKSFDTFCPLGPAIHVRPEWAALAVCTRLNGEERQRGRVEDMAWDPFDLLVYISRMMTLEAGDVVLTGTPAGVGPLADGDHLEVEVTGLGVLENPVEAWRQG